MKNEAQVNIQTPAQNPIQHLLALAAKDMELVDHIIRARMQSPVGMIPDLAEHLVGAGGKRLRPLLTIASAHICNYQGDGHYKLAAAVEFIHSATLLHDDVVDISDKRRGRQAANRIWGNAPSILVGDFLFARAFNLMVETGSLHALNILSTASSIIAEGEVQQLAALQDIEMSRTTYLEIIGAKTAALFAAAAEVSPVLAACSFEKQQAMKTYGQELGLAFQIVDDVLDYGGQEAALGKAIGDDFREGKMTLPVILALEKAQKVDDITRLNFWRRVMVDKDQNQEDLEQAIYILKDENAFEDSLVMARSHIKTAVQSLDIFENNTWKNALVDLANFVVDRVS